MTHEPDECVPILVHDDTCKRLTALYDIALETRAYVQAAAHTQLRPSRRRLREDAPLVLERLDAALADAQEVLS